MGPLYLGVVDLALQLFVLGDLPYRLHEVLLRRRQTILTVTCPREIESGYILVSRYTYIPTRIVSERKR